MHVVRVSDEVVVLLPPVGVLDVEGRQPANRFVARRVPAAERGGVRVGRVLVRPAARVPYAPAMPPSAIGLSRSRVMAGLQCHKRLWWTGHEPTAPDLPPDETLQVAPRGPGSCSAQIMGVVLFTF